MPDSRFRERDVAFSWAARVPETKQYEVSYARRPLLKELDDLLGSNMVEDAGNGSQRTTTIVLNRIFTSL